MDHQDTPSSIDNPGLSYIYQDHSNVRKREIITSLTNRIRDNIQIAEEDMAQVAGSFGKGLMTLLLGLKNGNVPITKEVVIAAVKNMDNGKEVMALLLDQRADEAKITKEVLKEAAGYGRSGREVIALLLD